MRRGNRIHHAVSQPEEFSNAIPWEPSIQEMDYRGLRRRGDLGWRCRPNFDRVQILGIGQQLGRLVLLPIRGKWPTTCSARIPARGLWGLVFRRWVIGSSPEGRPRLAVQADGFAAIITCAMPS
jgi:hypothetical protein